MMCFISRMLAFGLKNTRSELDTRWKPVLNNSCMQITDNVENVLLAMQIYLRLCARERP